VEAAQRRQLLEDSTENGDAPDTRVLLQDLVSDLNTKLGAAAEASLAVVAEGEGAAADAIGDESGSNTSNNNYTEVGDNDAHKPERFL